ncbi:Aconitate hydratase [compost metagenome]
MDNDVKPGQLLSVTAERQDGSGFDFTVIARLDSMVDVDYYHNGGILQTVLRQMIGE